MIIKSISAENFGKFDRYSVNLDDNINVFYGDNEAGKTTLYEIISILLFAPVTDHEIKESNKLIKADEKYARVYAIINLDGKEISIAREIYVNDTNLSIADQDNVSSLGNVNVPFIGDLTKEMYEAFHTIDYYNMATITNNVWNQIVKVIEESKGGPRITPDYSSHDDEEQGQQEAPFEDRIKAKAEEKKQLEAKLKEAQRTQKLMIKNQDKIDDLISDLEDIENNIELEAAYLKEAEKMNDIRDTIKKTQDLTLELEKYKDLRPWMPKLREYYEKLKLYSENKQNGIENPLDMFDDLEENAAEQTDQVQAASEKEEPESIEISNTVSAEKAADDESDDVSEITDEQEDRYADIKLPSEDDYNLAKEKISKFIEASYLKAEEMQNTQAQKNEPEEAEIEHAEPEQNEDTPEIKVPEKTEDIAIEAMQEEIEEKQEEKIIVEPEIKQSAVEDRKEEPDDQVKAGLDYLRSKIKKIESEKPKEVKEEKIPDDVKPLEIRKPKEMGINRNEETPGQTNSFGQTNPYSDNIFPDMDKVNYSGRKISYDKTNDEPDDDKYSLSSSNDNPTQTKSVSESELNEKDEKTKEDEILHAEEMLNSVDMHEIITASKEVVEVSDETKEEINRAKLRYNIVAKRIFNQEMDMDEVSDKLKSLDTNAIYKAIVKYKGLSQKLRKTEQDAEKTEPKSKSSGSSSSTALGFIAVLSMLLGLACFFIDQIVTLVPDSKALNEIYKTITGLPLNNIIPGNVLSGGAFILIAILLIIAIVLGNDKTAEPMDLAVVDDIELDDLKNNIRKAKRDVIDALKGFPIPSAYLENPNNTIISMINELSDVENAYKDLLFESKMPGNESYRALWQLAKKHLTAEELSDDLFDNIAVLRRKIKDYKEEKAEQERKLKEAKLKINMIAGNSMKNEKTQSSQFSGFNGFNGFNNTAKNTNTEELPDNAVDMPKKDFGMGSAESFNIESAKQENTFDTPYAVQEKQSSAEDFRNISENASFGIPRAQSSGFEQMHQEEKPEPEEPIASAKDESYPSMGGLSGTSLDNSYPSDGGMFGSAKDPGYPAETDEFGKAKSEDYPFKQFAHQEEDKPADAENADFGIPGIRRYAGDTSSEQEPAESSYGIPGIHRFGESTESAQSEESNPFDIPGIRRYIGNESGHTNERTDNITYNIPEVKRHLDDLQQSSNESDSGDFGIPGIHRYTNDAAAYQKTEEFEAEKYKIEQAQQEQHEKQSEQEDEFEIPGIHRYTNETQHTESEKSAGGIMSGLPGLDKFSNRKEQAEKEALLKNKEKDEIPVFVPPMGAEAVGTATAAGAAILGGLPGLDKFSNRKEQAEKKAAQEQEMARQTMEDDLFGIPGIKRYSGTESTQPKEDETIEIEEQIAKEQISVETEEVKSEEADLKVSETEPEIIAEDAEPGNEQEPDEEIMQEADPEEIKAKDRHEKEYDELLEILGKDPEDTIREVEDLTRELHKEIIRRDKAMGDLLKLNDAAVRLSTLSSSKWPYKQKAIDASRERIDYLEADKLKMQRHLDMLETKIEEVDYEETPQAISDMIKAAEEEIEHLKMENDKQALAEELIQKKKLLDMSSTSDRSHIINDTSAYMKELTLGKYIEVKINEELTGLSICDKDGQWFDTTKDRLSQATREQLYLALRISIADLFDEKSLIFPMFFDEALITWDKRRMKAVMRLLSKMSMHRQVIIFTCHDWLKDMIGDYLINAKIIQM